MFLFKIFANATLLCLHIHRFICLIQQSHPHACASTHLYLFGGEVFGAPEHVALGDALAAELMNLNHASECDEAHQGVGWQQAKGHLQGLLEGLEVLFFQTCVHHIQEDQRGRWSTLESGGREGYTGEIISFVSTYFITYTEELALFIYIFICSYFLSAK